MDILCFDVENLPNIASTWTLYDTRISHNNIIENQSLICIAWQWVGKKRTYCTSISDDKKRFEKNIYDDYHVVKEFHKVLNTDKSFVLLGHNSDRFDIRKFNTAAIKHGFEPVPERQSIDTLKQARKYFRFDSNRLDYLGRFLEVGEKLETGGYQLWNDIVQAKYPEVGKNPDLELAYKSVSKMMDYNKNDVRLLLKVFDKLKPYIKIPNHTLYSGKVARCTKCGSQDFNTKGWRYNMATRRRRYYCHTCKSNFDVPFSHQKYYYAALGLDDNGN